MNNDFWGGRDGETDNLGLFTKQDIKDFVTVGFFSQSDYDKMFPEG